MSHGRLGREGLLHVGNLTGVRALLHACEALKEVGVHAIEAVAEGHLDVAAAVAELRRKVLDALIDALNGGLEHLVAETVVGELGLIEPRVDFVTTYATSAIAATATITAATATEAAQEGKEDKEPPSTVPVTEAAVVVPATVASRSSDVRERVVRHFVYFLFDCTIAQLSRRRVHPTLGFD